MSQFVSRWSQWQTVGTSDQATDRTAKSPGEWVEVVSQSSDRTDKSQEVAEEVASQSTDRTAKSQETAADMASQSTDRTAKSQRNEADMASQSTDRTAKSPSGSFVSAHPETLPEPNLKIPAPGEVEAMSLAAFAQAGLVVNVYSEVLEAEILFVSDNVPEATLENQSLSVYRAEELRKLVRLGAHPRDLRQLHMVKDIFQGSITSVKEVDDE